MATNMIWRTLSAFNPSSRLWAPVSSLKNALLQSQVTYDQSLSLTFTLISWNIDAFSPLAVSRAKLILSHILDRKQNSLSPDIIFLQEVTTDVRASLLADPRVRAAFLVTDAEDQRAFENVPFATMTLLSRARFACASDDSRRKEENMTGGEEPVKLMPMLGLGRVSRVVLPSKYRRDALCVDIVIPQTANAPGPSPVLRLINVHLDSLGDTFRYRAQQLKILSDVLCEPGCGGGLVAGDFNAISSDDDVLVEKYGLVDAWVALHGREEVSDHDGDGATWSVGVQRRDGLPPKRLDKVAMMGSLLQAKEMQVMRPGLIEMPRPGGESIDIPWSDHCGLRCTITI